MNPNQPEHGFCDLLLLTLFAFFVFFQLSAKAQELPKPLLELNGAVDNKSGQFNRVVFSPDGKRLASTGQYGTVKIWDSSSGKAIFSLKSDPRTVWNVAFSPDGKLIASSNRDGTVKIWEADKGIEIRTLKGHGGAAFGVSYSPDGKHVASGSIDGTIKVWELTTGKEVINFNEAGSLHLTYNSDGKRLAAATGHSVKVWNTVTWKELLSLEDDSPIMTVAFSPDDKKIASAGSLGNSLIIWDAASGKKLFTIFAIYVVAFTPDGKMIGGFSDGKLKFWDPTTGKELVSLLDKKFGSSLSFSPDGKRLASVGMISFALLLPWIKAREGAAKKLPIAPASFDLILVPAWTLEANVREVANDAKEQPTKILLFMNTYGFLEMTPKEPIRCILDAKGKMILDLDPTKNGSQETEFKDSRFVRLSSWTVLKRRSLSLSPQSRGTAKVCLEGDSGQKEFFEIIVLDSALAVSPGETLRFQSPSKKPIKQIDVEQEKTASVKVEPADPTRAIAKGLAKGFSTIRLSSRSGDVDVLEIVVHPEKITEDKVLILSAGRDYGLRMSSMKPVSQVTNSDDKVLEIRTVIPKPEWVNFTTLKAGFTRLELAAKDNSRETFAVLVVDRKK